MRKLNPEHVKAMMAFSDNIPCVQLLDIKVIELWVGGCRIELDLARKHMNPYNGPYGGVYASLVDTATWWAIYAEMDEDVGYTTLDLHLDNLSTVPSGKLIAEGRTVKLGRTICLAEAFVRDEAGKLLVHGTSKLMVTPVRPPLDTVAAEFGLPPIPPKFIEA